MNTTESTRTAEFLDAWCAAEAAGDVAALDRHLAEDFLTVGPLGFTLSRQDWLDRHASGALTYESFELSELRTRQYGDVTVVVARQSVTGSYRNPAAPPQAPSVPVPDATRVTLVLTGGEQGRRLAGIQHSFIAGTPGAPPIPGAPSSAPTGGPR